MLVDVFKENLGRDRLPWYGMEYAIDDPIVHHNGRPVLPPWGNS